MMEAIDATKGRRNEAGGSRATSESKNKRASPGQEDKRVGGNDRADSRERRGVGDARCESIDPLEEEQALRSGGSRRSRSSTSRSAATSTIYDVPSINRSSSSARHREQEQEMVKLELKTGDAEDDDLGAGKASYGDDLDTLDRRRTEELKLIGEYDSANINPRRECWFIVDTKWLQSWAKFVRGEGPPPGRMSNEGLVESDLKTPVDGLVSRVDYRGVNPTVWFLYLEMYGKDSAQDLCRYVIDLYEAEVPQKYMREICEGPMRRAQVEVQKMRWRVEPEEVRLPEKPRLCCCITEQVIDCVFMSLFTCCAKWRRRCPAWLCCCFFCCPGRTSGSGGRYSRVTTSLDTDDDSSDGDDAPEEYESSDNEIDHGAREEEEDLYRLGKGRTQGSQGSRGGRRAPHPQR